MDKYQIAVYKAEREAGLTSLIRSTAAIAYIVEATPLEVEVGLRDQLHNAFAAQHGEDNCADLYYMRDVLASTGWNKNKDIFDRTECWLARHTPEDKPFNFEHRPLEIIGHITTSHVVDENFYEVSDDITIDELPAKFHIINGSVLYVHSSDAERKTLMEQTVAEIKKGEWFVSMECLFRGFDYGVIGPDGSQRVIARDESTAFLTKHLAQYGGSGTYKCDTTGNEFTLGRVLKNITFSGKGLVRKPANPESIIFQTVSSFMPTITNSGYLTSGPKAISEKTTEPIIMAETNVNDQALRDLNARLEKDLSAARAEIEGLKNKDTEVTIEGLRNDIKTRDGVIANLEAEVKSLKAQVDTVTASVTVVQKRAEAAETALAAAQEEVKVAKNAETKRAREASLRQKNAPEDVIAGLIENLAVLDDAAFTKTVETISASWKKPETAPKTKADPVITAVQKAKAEEEPSMATGGENQTETAEAVIVDFMGKHLKHSRGGRPVYSNTNNE